MKIHFVTIVLDGMPFITHHLPVFNSLACDWDWTIVEGVAEPLNDTAWCKRIPPRWSSDGTHEYLLSIAKHPRVRFIADPIWPGKVVMFNTALSTMKDSGLLWEADADELWTKRQIELMVQNPQIWTDHNCADFYCRYFVGWNIVVDRIPGTWTNSFDTMWRRVWRFEPGMHFKTHEPPVFGYGQWPNVQERPRKPISHEQTAPHCVFDHYAYVTEAQLRFKEVYYGYAGALDGWRRLQRNTQWPAKLKDFLPWVKDEATARPLYA